MEGDKKLAEAKRLYDLGFGIHWLHSKSKRPIESGWTTGPRKDWAYLKKSYDPRYNVGVRLGSPSKIKNKFLGVIDVDVKSVDPKHTKEVIAKLKSLNGLLKLPRVKSGRGNGSQHLYMLTDEPMKARMAFRSPDIIKVDMAGEKGKKPSKREIAGLTEKEIARGVRLRPAWEIGIMGEGQQVVLPPSIHPDSGKNYKWLRDFKPQLALDFDVSVLPNGVDKPVGNVDKSEIEVGKRGPKTLEGFELAPVEIGWLPISEKIRQMIMTGEGVEDRSASLMPISRALVKAGLTRNEVLTVLTDTENYIGQTAYHHAKTRDRLRAAAWVFRYTLARVESESSAAAMFAAPIKEAVERPAEAQEADMARFDELHDWRMDLDTTKDDNVRATLKNTVSILENEVGAAIVKRDTFAYRDFYSDNTPWGGKKDAAVNDDDVIKIKLWIADNFACEPNKNIIGEALTILATRNAFDPLVEWLDGLAPWDGVERIDGWLLNHFHAKGDHDYLAQVFRKWLVAMVMRVYEPGAKFDWMPIFEGAQGIGKSSFGRLLCGDKYFLDWLPDLANKDSALALQGIWSVEMGELASFRKNEIETVKAFITRTVDKVRPPYGERWLEVRRRCVFFGTTNFETYLRDESGNRRFKPVKVGRLDFETLERERNQLFAEALWLYRAGFETERTLEISGDAKIYEATIQNEKMISDEAALMQEKLVEFFTAEMAKPEDERFTFSRFKMGELFEGTGGGTGSPFLAVGPLKAWKYDSRNVQFAAKALKNLGAANFKANGVRYYKITI